MRTHVASHLIYLDSERVSKVVTNVDAYVRPDLSMW